MIRWLALSACIWSIHGLKEPEETKLLFLQILFRHGDRTPTNVYANDPNPVDVWPEGINALTKLGKIQHYFLGKLLRSRYRDFITSDPKEVFVNSSEVEYVINSAEVHLASLFEPTLEWKFVDNLNWQPIPVYYQPAANDKYLSKFAICPRVKAIWDEYFQSPEFEEKLVKYTPLLDKVQHLLGKDNETYNFPEIRHAIDAIWIEKRYGLMVPSWAESDDLQEAKIFLLNSHFSSPVVVRLKAGPLLGNIIENMNKKISGETPEMKVRVFAAHDYNIVGMLTALNLFNNIFPPYCATILFELHEIPPEGRFAVRLLFLNSTEPESGYQVPYVLKLEGCSELCPLEFFINYTRPVIPEDWDAECQL